MTSARKDASEIERHRLPLQQSVFRERVEKVTEAFYYCPHDILYNHRLKKGEG